MQQREIKFRAWDEKLKRWEEWRLPEDAGYMAGRFNKENATKKGRRFSTSTLSQYTGLNDKNGKEIYEGDVLLAPFAGWDKTERIFVVEWNHLSWDLRQEQSYKPFSYWFTSKELKTVVEVIGNICENPGLLKA
jgi:uncharacterized phage protein (TIGR01671 family)